MGCQALKGMPTLAAPWSLRKGLRMRSGILCPASEKELLPVLGGPFACENTLLYEMDLRGGGWWNGDVSAR